MNTLNQPKSVAEDTDTLIILVLAQFEFEVPKMLPTVFLRDVLVPLEIQSWQ